MEDKEFKREAFIYLSFAAVMAGVAYYFGFQKGHILGLNEFRKMHVDTTKVIIDQAACDAAFEALDMVRSNPSAYETLMKNPDAVLVEVQKAFYKRDNTKALLEALQN